VSTHHALLMTIGVTTISWVVTAFVSPATDRQVLIDFYRKVRPFGPGWARIRQEAGVSEAEAAASHENFPLALLGWSAGCATIWSSLFVVGSVLYGRWSQAAWLFGVFVVAGLILLKVIRILWDRPKARA
jgi:SSS family solute:Na+ symporter